MSSKISQLPAATLPGTGDLIPIVQGGTNKSITNSLMGATQAQMEAAAALFVWATPGIMQHHPGVAKAQVSFNGTGTPASRGTPYNFSSITDNGTGDWTVNLTTAFSTGNQCALHMAGRGVGGGNRITSGPTTADPTSTTYRAITFTTAFANADTEYLDVAQFGDQ